MALATLGPNPHGNIRQWLATMQEQQAAMRTKRKESGERLVLESAGIAALHARQEARCRKRRLEEEHGCVDRAEVCEDDINTWVDRELHPASEEEHGCVDSAEMREDDLDTWLDREV